MDALARLAPVSDDYARLPMAQALTWGECAAGVPPGEWYLVVFRSILRADADKDRLQAYDDFAHAEAEHAPGFVHYFKGPLVADRSCLSFCLWSSRAEARASAGRPAHRDAISILGETYEEYVLEFLRVRKRDVAAALEFEAYDPQPDPSPVPHRKLGFSAAAS